LLSPNAIGHSGATGRTYTLANADQRHVEATALRLDDAAQSLRRRTMADRPAAVSRIAREA